ncbi:MAG: hypothetical protein ACE5FL_05115, partial [Myxococcota bacterium]
YCEGRGYVLSSESVAYKVLREIRKDLPRFCGRQIAVTVNPEVAEVLLGAARRARADLTAELGREIEIRARPGLHQEQFEVKALDEGPPVSLELNWLSERAAETAEVAESPAAEASEAAESETAEMALVAESEAVETPIAVETGEAVEAAPVPALDAPEAAGDLFEDGVLPGGGRRARGDAAGRDRPRRGRGDGSARGGNA